MELILRILPYHARLPRSAWLKMRLISHGVLRSYSEAARVLGYSQLEMNRGKSEITTRVQGFLHGFSTTVSGAFRVDHYYFYGRLRWTHETDYNNHIILVETLYGRVGINSKTPADTGVLPPDAIIIFIHYNPTYSELVELISELPALAARPV